MATVDPGSSDQATLGLLAIVLVVIFVVASVRVVRPGRARIVRRFGQHSRVLGAGVHFLAPFVDSLGPSVDVSEHELDITVTDVRTVDSAVSLRVAGTCRVLDPLSAVDIPSIPLHVQHAIVDALRTVVAPLATSAVLGDLAGCEWELQRQLGAWQATSRIEVRISSVASTTV